MTSPEASETFSGAGVRLPLHAEGKFENLTRWISYRHALVERADGFRINFFFAFGSGKEKEPPRLKVKWVRGDAAVGETIVPLNLGAVVRDGLAGRADVLPHDIPRQADAFQLVSEPLGSDATLQVTIDRPGGRENRARLPQCPWRMTATKSAAWWPAGEEISFSLCGEPLPNWVKKFMAVVYSSDGNEVFRESLEPARVQAEGWRWRPVSPGFYEVEFSLLSEKGPAIALDDRYTQIAPNGRSLQFVRERRSFAVLGTGDDGRAYHSRQFGFSYLLGDTAVDIDVAKKLGFGAALFHGMPWGGFFKAGRYALEPAPGTWNWDMLDAHVAALSAAKFRITGQLLFTPLWASPHSEKNSTTDIVTPGMAYAPRNMADWRRFVEATVTRYRDRIDSWEIWNEPSMPGKSVFWHDTPEKYVEMLLIAHEAIRRLQPQAEIWNGGLGPAPAYQEFYRRILPASDDLFDVLSLHGRWGPMPEMRKIEAALEKKPKKAVVSEWHAILSGQSQSHAALSEKGLSYRMMVSLCYQLKWGVEATYAFMPVNRGSLEVENLPFAVQQGWFHHSSGLFRYKPVVEPRHAGLVLHNFIAASGGEAKYVDERVHSNGLRVVNLTTLNGPLAVIWLEHELPVREVASAMRVSEPFFDWEAKLVSADQILLPKTVYYVAASVSDNTALVPADFLKRPDDHLVGPISTEATQGAGVRERLFGINLNKQSFDPALWNSLYWVPNGSSQNGSPAVEAKFLVGATDASIDIAIDFLSGSENRDAITAFPERWISELAIQTNFSRAAVEFRITKDNSAKTAAVLKISGPDLEADIPPRWSAPNRPAQYVQGRWQSISGGLRLELNIPWSELFPLELSSESQLFLRIKLIQAGADESRGWLRWPDAPEEFLGKIVLPKVQPK